MNRYKIFQDGELQDELVTNAERRFALTLWLDENNLEYELVETDGDFYAQTPAPSVFTIK